MRQLRRASPLARIVATLGVLIVLQAGAILRYGSKITFVTSELPVTVLHPFGITISVDRFILIGIAAALTLGLWLLYRYTQFGIATTAVAENQRAASAVGLSPGLDRHRQLGARIGARRGRRDPDRPDRAAAGRQHDEPRAGRAGDCAGRRASGRSRSPSPPAC